MEEIWKDIKEYEGLYQVSNLGRVKSFIGWTGKKYYYREKILKPQPNSNGYLRVVLKKNDNSKTYFVHRLVAETFIPNPNNYSVVNHKDENIKNNCADNLEWCTFKYNINYGTLRERQAKKCGKKILQIDKNGNLVKCWDSIREAGRTLGLHAGTISKCCNKNIYCKTCGGYIWRFGNSIEDVNQEDITILNGNCKKVYQYSIDGKFIKEWISLKDASSILNIPKTCISDCCNKRHKTAGGYVWRYSTNEQFNN